MQLDTPETIKALARTNDIAKARKLALSTIERESRNASSLEALRLVIDQAMAALTMAEHEAINRK